MNSLIPKASTFSYPEVHKALQTTQVHKKRNSIHFHTSQLYPTVIATREYIFFYFTISRRCYTCPLHVEYQAFLNIYTTSFDLKKSSEYDVSVTQNWPFNCYGIFIVDVSMDEYRQ